jgi:hypothetical protein
MNRLFCLLLATAALPSAPAQPIPVRYQQGSSRGFLIVRSAEGKVIGVGDAVQVADGVQFRSRLVLRFRDGSVDDDATMFAADRELRLISDHHVQKGPSFPNPLDVTIDVPFAEVKWRQVKNGKVESGRQHMQLPKDLGNGILPLVMQNLRPGAPETRVPYLVNDPKPRIVTLSIKPDGNENFAIAGVAVPANRYAIRIEIGGIGGLVASLIGKQPPDMHEWVIAGEVPSLARMEAAFYQGAPTWTVELASPERPSKSRP